MIPAFRTKHILDMYSYLLAAAVYCLVAGPVHAGQPAWGPPSWFQPSYTVEYPACKTAGTTATSSSSIIPQPSTASTWSGWGGNTNNNRWAAENTQITSTSILSLAQHCKIPYPKGISATPTILGDVVYYPTWGGLLVALNYKTCVTQWQLNVTALVTAFAPLTATQKAVAAPVSRTSPQIENGVLYFGTLAHALLFAVRADTGVVLGSIQINPHPLAVLTMSPTAYNGRIFIGASSQEETAADAVPGYACCTFVGNMAALTFDTSSNHFTVAWNISMLPSPAGNWSGAAIWGSQPAIDEARSQVFIATGNVYTLPDAFEACQNQSQNIQVVAEGLTVDPCLPPNVYQESVLAIDIELGIINWANQLTPLDAWTLACGISAIGIPRSTTLCAYEPGPDADFGMAPTFVPGGAGTPYAKDVVVIGQKNGNLYALSAQAGRVFWSTVTSPDGPEGGLIWGVAVTDSQVFFTAVNTNSDTWSLQPSNRNISSSAFGSVSLANGSILWETQAPNNSFSLVPPSVANDVAFFGVTDVGIANAITGTHGSLVMLNARSGEVIREVALGVNFHGGIAIQDQYVMFGSGMFSAPL